MRRVVLDATAFLNWFRADAAGNALRNEYERGVLSVVVPRELTADVLSKIGRSPRERLIRVAAELDRLGFEVREPPIDEIASWLAQGLTPSQAGYAALASSLDLPLVTSDPELARRAATVALSIGDG